MKKQIFTFTLFFFLSFLLHGQNFLKTQGKIIVDGNGDTVLLRGMGLGGWMLQEGYMLQTAGFATAQYQIRDSIEQLIGTADTDVFYNAWLANHCRKIDIDSLKAWGFNAVRLPMHYNLFTLPIEDEPIAGQHTWLTKGFDMTDSLISWCAQNQMWVILDLHAAPGGQGYDQAISDYDPTKPSLWESQANRDKMVALWKKLAERYVNEPWIAAYDLLNEPNWNLPGNTLLKSLYVEVMDSIRSVDNNHMIFIEGNWFANDFTGLTPPWDNNMVYSPHKYWSHNEDADIQWVLTIRDQHNTPLYFGESGENSNVWFRDAIKLFEDHNIGWAWWPLKKIESIAGPLSIPKSQNYQTLLDYWNNGGTKPSAAFAKSTLMQLTQDLKLENCRYQKDVIDAMFRQVQSDKTLPFSNQNIPGVVFGSDYDLGVVGEAYFDTDVANYSVSTGNYSSWNTGWAYRNDGVDIEVCSDNINTSGYNVGWINTNEWLQYTVNVAADAVYDVKVRVAADTDNGQFRLLMDGADISSVYTVPNSNGWQNWQTVTVQDVILSQNDKKLRFYADSQGFNFSSMEFIQKGSTTSIPTDFFSGTTVDANKVQIHLNKPLQTPLPTMPANFSIIVDGASVPILNMWIEPNNARIINFVLDYNLAFDNTIQASYNGTQINAIDGTVLNTFTLEDIQNNLPVISLIPGKLEAENYFFQVGTQLEVTNDVNGGYNIGYLDAGDYLDYNVEVASSATYNINYRTAALSEVGGLDLQLIDSMGTSTTLQSITFQPTGSWTTWATTTGTATIPAGRHTFRIKITQPLFNLNWVQFDYMTSDRNVATFDAVQVFPNPSTGQFHLNAHLSEQQNVSIQIFDLVGRIILEKQLNNISNIQEVIDLSDFPNGHYILKAQSDGGAVFTDRLVKLD